MLKMGALWQVSIVSMHKMVEVSYINPTVNSSNTAIFFLLFICNFQSALTGTKRMMKSVIVLKTPSVLSMVDTLMHVPSIDLSHIRARGTHSHVLRMMVVI